MFVNMNSTFLNVLFLFLILSVQLSQFNCGLVEEEVEVSDLSREERDGDEVYSLRCLVLVDSQFYDYFGKDGPKVAKYISDTMSQAIGHFQQLGIELHWPRFEIVRSKNDDALKNVTSWGKLKSELRD